MARPVGRPKEFDLDLRLNVNRDLHRRVQAFAEVNDMKIATAYRVLVGIALDQLERSTIDV